jgi:hypothetical protein
VLARTAVVIGAGLLLGLGLALPATLTDPLNQLMQDL